MNRSAPDFTGAFTFTVVLIGLIAAATFDSHGWRFIFVMLGMVSLAVIFFHLTFPGSRFFIIALSNSLGAYACMFMFFLDTNFKDVADNYRDPGFALPILAFMAGAWWRRDMVRGIIKGDKPRPHRIGAVEFMWLAPVMAIGAVTFAIPNHGLDETAVGVIFLLSMSAIAIIVALVSPSVSLFLIDTGLRFEEFFGRVNQMATAAFAFITFYSVIVIAFAALYRIIDLVSNKPNFAMMGIPKPISFPESLYFSIVTMATVGYGDITPASDLARIMASVQVILGVLLLLFGFSELTSFVRDHRAKK